MRNATLNAGYGIGGVGAALNGLYTVAWTTGLAVGPVVAGATLGGGHGTALFVGLAVACVVTGFAALRLGRHLPPSVDVVAWARDEFT